MKPLRIPRTVDALLVFGAILCLVAASAFHQQYVRAHVAASDAKDQVRVAAAGDTQKMWSILQAQQLASPEIYFRRARSASSWTFWMFCGGAVCGLLAQRWLVVVVTLFIWIAAVAMTGTRV
jgi:hypothetical protein